MAETGTDLDGPVADSDATIVLDDVHVTYRVHGDQRPRLKDLFRGSDPTTARPDEAIRKVLAVRGVTLVASRGEAIGLIGRNGSGKSTLMQAMAGLLPVTSGEVYASSQPALLGVGAALQPNVSGRRNIVLGGLALGLSKSDVEDMIDDIIEFSGLSESIDLPLKTYSSGMKARLLFSISTAARPEILLIDEALAVGDEVFRKRSQKRIEELIELAGTVFIVSHSLEEIRRTCNRAVWLEQGTVRADGEPEDVIKAYRESIDKEG